MKMMFEPVADYNREEYPGKHWYGPTRYRTVSCKARLGDSFIDVSGSGNGFRSYSEVINYLRHALTS